MAISENSSGADNVGEKHSESIDRCFNYSQDQVCVDSFSVIAYLIFAVCGRA
jgi:hypothetical protein